MTEQILDIDELRAASAPGSDRAKAAGKRMFDRRRYLKMRRQTLADAVGSTPQTINRIESGQIIPREYLRQAIAYALCLEVEEIWPQLTRVEMKRLASR